MRLDRTLVDRGLARSRTEAQSFIDADLVRVDGKVITKASIDVDDRAHVEVTGTVCPYVSRGGMKLEAALDHFAIDPNGLLCLDIGASTGGFTDCLLQRGAAHVVAVDVGHDQLHPTLARDPRITHREGINARSMKSTDFEVPFDLIVADLSFISLTLVMPSISTLTVDGGQFVLLVKPQFEVGPTGLGKGGIVRSDALRREALDRVKASAEANRVTIAGTMTSPITGGDGNEEYLLYLTR